MIRRRLLLLSAFSASGLSAGCVSAATGHQSDAGPARARGENPARTHGENEVVLSGAAGRSLDNWPLRFARPFRQGEIAGAPGILIDGRPVVSQADVKTRWADGSVRHAVLSCVVPRVPAGGSLRLTFVNQPAGSQAGLSREQMLDPAFNFDATMVLTRDGQSQTASARAFLQAGHYTVWCQGPVATTIILADHSAERRYDFGFESVRPVRPVFHATFWPSLHAVEVRVIGENASTEALQDTSYDLRVTGGMTPAADILLKAGLQHYAGTRWTKRFWIGAQPDTRVDIDHGLGYLGLTTALPVFDTSIDIPEQIIAGTYAAWLKTPRGLFEAGGWRSYMPTTGGRDDLGHVTGPISKWLYTGDHRLFDMVSGMADLAAAWPMHLREGKAGVSIDAAGKISGLGHPVSVYGRPTLWQFDSRDKSRPQDSAPIRQPRLLQNPHDSGGGGWVADNAHAPDPYSPLYLLTGDFFALEQLQFWSATQAMRVDPAYRGASGTTGAAAMHDQDRGEAWALRGRVEAAALSPDGTPEKVYFAAIVDDAVSFWEGVRGISGTRFEGNRLWKLGRMAPFAPPLHVWSEGKGDLAHVGLNPALASTAIPEWQSYFLLVELGSARDQGFPTQPLFSWLAVSLSGQFGQPGYDPTNLDRYLTPVRKADGNFFQSWAETVPVYMEPTPKPLGNDVCDGYASYAYAASTFLVNEPGGRAAYEWLRREFFERNRGQYPKCPKWAMLPRPA